VSGPPDLLKSILDGVAQPVWVIDPEGRIIFANPAAVDALGYDDASDLLGKPSHETVHYKRPDGSPYPADECPMLLPRQTGETVHGDDEWFVRRDGSMFPISFWSAPLDTPGGRGAVLAFSDIEQRRQAERAERERDVAQARAAEARAAQRRTIEAADTARRRVTRDLHDGAQQELVNVVINLQLAQAKWDSDPERARELVDAAAEQAQASVASLRELAAGIHPTILTNRGLQAAIEALADRLPLLVRPLQVLPERLPATIEASVYFFVSEALTNVVKHAQASSASVRATAEAGTLTVEVSDDGVGGADPHAAGSGLSGLGDRVAALDGSFDVLSEAGAGTTLRAVIPLPG
jgi:PAS domain S-box-containing protein